MAKKPTVIANQQPRPVRLDQAGRHASSPVGQEHKGQVRQVGTANTAIPARERGVVEAGPMVVRPLDPLKLFAPPPELVAAMDTAKNKQVKEGVAAKASWSTRGMDFSARLAHLKEHNAELKQRMVSLEAVPGAAKEATPKATSRIKAALARRKPT